MLYVHTGDCYSSAGVRKRSEKEVKNIPKHKEIMHKVLNTACNFEEEKNGAMCVVIWLRGVGGWERPYPSSDAFKLPSGQTPTS